MEAIVDIYHDKRRAIKDSESYPVKIRVTYARVTRFFRTGVQMSQEEFERFKDGKYLKESLKTRAEKLGKLRSAFEDAVERTVPFNFDRLKQNLNPVRKQASIDMFALFEIKIAELKEGDQVSTYKSYSTCLNTFRELSGKKTLPFYEISPEWLMHSERKLLKKGTSIGSVGVYMRYLRHLYNRAIEEGHVDRQLYPFGQKGYRIKSPEKTKKALSKQGLISLMQYWATAEGAKKKALDYWFFSLYSNGINMRDILELKWKQIEGETLKLRRVKTRGTSSSPTEITIHLTAYHFEIMERQGNSDRSANAHIFPEFQEEMTEEQKYQRTRDRRKYVGQYTKQIARELELNIEVRFETARHSFANSLKYLNFSTSIISDMMGHSSTLTTDKYLGSIQTEEEKKVINTFIGSLIED